MPGQSADTGWSAGWIDRLVSGPLIPHNLGGMQHKFAASWSLWRAVEKHITDLCQMLNDAVTEATLTSLWFLKLNGISFKLLLKGNTMELHIYYKHSQNSPKNVLLPNFSFLSLYIFSQTKFKSHISKPLWQEPHPVPNCLGVSHQNIYWRVSSMKLLCMKRLNDISFDVTSSNQGSVTFFCVQGRNQH